MQEGIQLLWWGYSQWAGNPINVDGRHEKNITLIKCYLLHGYSLCQVPLFKLKVLLSKKHETVI